MPTLHDATEETKKLLLYGGIGVAVLILIVFIIKAYISTIKTPPTPPTMCYGKVPLPQLPQNATYAKLTYHLQTISGNLPYFSTKIFVPRIATPQPDLLALDNASNSATAMGFTLPPVEISNNTFEWTKDAQLTKTLQINVLSHNFFLNSTFLGDQTVASGVNLPADSDANGIVQAFYTNVLSGLNDTIASSIDVADPVITHYQLQNNTLSLLTNDAFTPQIIRVDYNQNPIQNCYIDANGSSKSCPIYYSNYPNTTVNAIIGAENQVDDADVPTLNIIQSEYFPVNIANTSCSDSSMQATYPLRSVQDAYSDLIKAVAHKTAIVSYSGSNNQVVVTDVKLAYLSVDKEGQQYLLPVYVFLGQDNFVAFVSAITDEATQM